MTDQRQVLTDKGIERLLLAGEKQYKVETASYRASSS